MTLCSFSLSLSLLQASLTAQLEQVQSALMNKSMELSETVASLREAAAEERGTLLERHRMEKEIADQVRRFCVLVSLS